MPLAAIYARKSNERNVADEDKSFTRQIEMARVCATRHGFEVPQDHVYVDDAISEAEFDRRPGLMRLLNAIRPRAPFAALVLADKDRLGREQFETNHILKQISPAGVRIFEYQNGGREVRLESSTDKLIMSVSNFAAELATRLRIVSDELWASAHDSLRTRQKSFGLKRALPRLSTARAGAGEGRRRPPGGRGGPGRGDCGHWDRGAGGAHPHPPDLGRWRLACASAAPRASPSTRTPPSREGHAPPPVTGGSGELPLNGLLTPVTSTAVLSRAGDPRPRWPAASRRAARSGSSARPRSA
jgi:hypothetical protein